MQEPARFLGLLPCQAQNVRALTIRTLASFIVFREVCQHRCEIAWVEYTIPSPAFGIMWSAFLLTLLPAAIAVPAAAPAPVAEPTVYEARIVRAPEPTELSGLAERGLIDDVSTFVDGIASDVGGEISGFLDSGILDFPTGFPTGTAVSKSLGLSDNNDLDAQPTQVLNVP